MTGLLHQMTGPRKAEGESVFGPRSSVSRQLAPSGRRWTGDSGRWPDRCKTDDHRSAVLSFYFRSIFKVLITMSSTGRSIGPRFAFDMPVTTSMPSITSPKIVCLSSNQGVAATVTKN